MSAALEQARGNIEQMDLLLAALGNTPARMLRRRRELIGRIDELQVQNQRLFDGELGPQRESAEAAAALPRSAGHELARQQMAKPGMARYRDAQSQVLNLMHELGALADEMSGEHRPMEGIAARLRREYAAVGLSLYELGNKMHLDLIECMAVAVSGDERRHTDEDERP